MQSEDFTEKDKIINALSKLKDRTYNGVSDLTTSSGLVINSIRCLYLIYLSTNIFLFKFNIVTMQYD